MTAKVEGIGERRERFRRRRMAMILGIIGLIGGIVGFMVGAHGYAAARGPALPPALAIGAAMITVIGVSGGAVVYFRQIDELERQVNHWAANVSLYYYLLTSAAWYLLWKGALVPEPSHEAMLASTFVIMCIAYSWKKLRP